jgi:hypothetical protein
MGKLNISPEEFKNLTQAVAEAVAQGFNQGSKKSKDLLGANLLKQMKDDISEINEKNKQDAFAAQVRNKALADGVSTRVAEIQILAKQQIAQNNLLLTTNQRRTAELGMLKLQAMQAGNTSLAKSYDDKIKKSNDFAKSIMKENQEIESTSKHLAKKLIQQDKEAAYQAKQDEVKEKLHEINKSLRERVGITDELIDQLRTPELAKAVFAEQTAEKLHKAYEGFEDFKKQGLSAGQAVQAQFKGLSIASMMGLSDTKGVMNGVIEQYGNVNALSKDTVNELGKMAHHFGISGEEAAKLNASLSQMPGETAETAAGAMETVGHMAEVQGIAPGKIMKDMAANTAAMALYGGKGAKEFGKSAIELHKMGIDISTASNMASKLLDFESSINAQTEASVLLGKEINFDKARELALTGDLAGAAKEVVAQAGGEAEWAKMNVLQKQKLAEAAGMTVEEMQKQIDAQAEHNKYFGEEAGLMDNIIGKTLEIGGGVIGFMKDNAMWMASTAQMLGQMNLGKIKQYALDGAHWVKQKAQWAAEKAHWLWMKMTGKGGGAEASSSAPKDSGKSTGGLTKSIEKINPGKLLAGAAALVLVAAAVFVFAKAAQEFMNVSWGAVAKAIVGMLALVGALYLMGTFMAGPQALFLLAGAAAMLIVAAAVYVLGKAVQEMAKGFDLFVPSLLLLAPMAMQIVVLGAGMALLGAGMLALGYASLIAFPGLMLSSMALLAMLPSLLVMNQIAQAGAFTLMGEGLLMMAAAGPGLGLVALSMMGIGAGLGMVALAGLAAMPVIGSLIALAAVAPALAGLGTALGGMFGGEEGESDDKMDTLIGKIDQLIAVASSGGEVKMDGKKVGEVIRLGLNTSGVR